MNRYETFSECLQRCLDEGGLSASEAARLVGFKSRNSIFRILQGRTSAEVNEKFLAELQAAVGSRWPEETWRNLHETLTIERLGIETYLNNQAFAQMLHEPPRSSRNVCVQTMNGAQPGRVQTLGEVLDEALGAERVEIVLTGCCDAGVMQLLAEKCALAGDDGRLTIRHYIDTTEPEVVRCILALLPLVGKSWYNARLVDQDSCPKQMQLFYRISGIYINCRSADGWETGHQIVCVGDNEYLRQMFDCACPVNYVLDRWRFHLELLKPTLEMGMDAQAFLDYTAQYAELEKDCVILSIKPDVHFNCIAPELLEEAITEGFGRAGVAQGEELHALVAALYEIQQGRFENTLKKRRMTHLVYSLDAMERFMQTGVLGDQLFIQRAYTVRERREIVRTLRDAMLENPYFHVHFFKQNLPDLCNEISYYGGRGVMLMDAYTGYDLEREHSEALITLPEFMEQFRRYFMEELLVNGVVSRAESLALLERLMQMDVSE